MPNRPLHSRLRPHLSRLLRLDFLRREDGVIAIEAMIVLPMMFWTFLALFSIFDAFHRYNLNQKAAYTIGDAISRETNPLDDAYLDGALGLFEYMTKGRGEVKLRVTSIWYDAATDTYKQHWSHSRGDVAPLADSDVAQAHDTLPVMPDKEFVMLVETWNAFEPAFRTGLENTNIRNRIFTRPRYARCVLWDTGANDTENTCVTGG